MDNLTYDFYNGVPLVPADYKQVKNKKARASIIMRNFLTKIIRMFEYEGGFSYIPAWRREQYTMINGQSFTARHNGRAWLLAGNPGGELNELFLPKKYWAKTNRDIGTWTQGLEIGKDGVLWRNDSQMMGVMPVLQYYASMLAENELSLYRAMINSRDGLVFLAGNDRDRAGVKEYLDSLEAGEAGAILNQAILNGIQVQPGATTSGIITNLIEAEQYLKAALFNEFGLDANYNMKREALNSTEAQMNSDALLSLPREMLECRKEACEQENDLLGDLMDLGPESVKFNGSWMEAEAEVEAAIAQFEALAEEPDADDEAPADGEPEDKIKEEEDAKDGSDEAN